MTNPQRAIAIIRVSREGDRGDDLLSPDIQRTAIISHCERRDLSIVEWVEAIDESGSQDRSSWWRRLDAAVEQIEDGQAEAIVAWKFSRVSRHRLRWATAVDRVERAGGTLESATEGIDTTTSTGRFTRGMLAELNAYYAEQVGDNWRETHQNRLARGLPANGKPRFGYRYDAEEKIHRPDPVTGPVLAETYRRYVAGESIYSLVRWLNAEGVRTVAGYGKQQSRLWSDRSLRRTLDSGFGAGVLNVHDPKCTRKHTSGTTTSTSFCTERLELPGAHEPVIGADLWTQYREQRRARSVTRSSERSVYLLSGMLRCVYVLDDGGVCGSSMQGGLFGHARVAKYRCKNGHAQRVHPGGYVTMSYVEEKVMAWLRELAEEVESAVKVAEAETVRRDVSRRALQRQRDDAERDLESATRRYLADKIPEAVWPSIRADLEGQVQALDAKLGRLDAVSRQDVPQVVAATALEDWPTLPVEHKRGALRRLIARIEILPGRHEKTDRFWRSRVTIVPAGQEDRPMGEFRH